MKKKIIIYSLSWYGREIYRKLKKQDKEFDVLCFIDADPLKAGAKFDGIEVKSNIREDDRIIISIGDEFADLDMLSIDVLKYEDTLLRAIEYIESKGYRFIVFTYDYRGVMQIVRDGETNANINGEQFKIELTTMLINNTPPTNYLRLFFKK